MEKQQLCSECFVKRSFKTTTKQASTELISHSTHTHTKRQTHLADVNRDPLTAPKQDSPTKTGISQDITPRWYSPKLWQNKQNTFRKGTERENRWFKADALKTYHSDRLWCHHDLRGDGGEVGQVGQDVHHRHYRHGYDDREGQVPVARGGSHMSRSWPNSNVPATSRSLLFDN